MKVNGVLSAQESWVRLMKCRFAPGFAYRLAKYGKLVEAELQLAEEQKTKLVQRYGQQTGPQAWSIEPTSEHFAEFMAEYQPLLIEEADLKPCEFTLDRLMEELEKYPENTIEPTDLLLLEPFFTQPEEAAT